nr:lysoplasmalogenase [Propionibacterium sp.]
MEQVSLTRVAGSQGWDRPVSPVTKELARDPLGPFPLQRGQRATVAVFGVVAVVVAVLVLAGAPEGVVRWLKTPPIAALFVLALIARPRTPTQVLLTAALLFSTLGDAFLVGFVALPGGAGRLAGIGTFAVAYLVLVATFWRGRPRRVEARPALGYAAVALVLCVVIWPFLPGAMVIPVVVFAVIIVLMGWTTVSTVFRGAFPARVAVWVATGGALIFANDAMVALHMFHPAFDPPPAVTEAFIRSTYLAGWVLMLLVVQLRPPVRPVPAAGQPSRLV